MKRFHCIQSSVLVSIFIFTTACTKTVDRLNQQEDSIRSLSARIAQLQAENKKQK